MKDYFKNHPLGKIGLFVIPIIIFIILMEMFFPDLAPEGFQSFILAFEFAQTPADINNLFGNLSAEEIWKTDVGNYLDYGYMILYTSLLISAFNKLAKELNIKYLRIGIYISILVFLSDFIENIFLLKLTTNYLDSGQEAEMISNLHFLNIFTWAKWFSLSILFALLYSIFYKEKWYIKIPMVVFLFPLLYLIASPERTPEMLTNFTNAIFCCFAVLVLFLFITPKKWLEKNRR